MKKFTFICICAMILGTAGFRVEADDVWSKIALYIPNRFMDALDIVTVSVGVGPVIRAEVHATRALAFGVGAGAEVMAVKGCNRQYGVCREAGYDLSFAMFNKVCLTRDGESRLVEPFVIDEDGFPLPGERLYEFYHGARDYWELGGSLALGIAGTLAIHPIEIADFITGIFFIDLKDDDITGEDL
ncbi:MAG: hypothetical protein PHH77_01050 [Victivallaceae bacterium]|nr:hypothetical protein [Victivallaceae bacterium]